MSAKIKTFKASLELTRRADKGYKKLVHTQYNMNECFADIAAVKATMQSVETHVLTYCNLSLSAPVKQTLDDPVDMCTDF